MTTTWNPSDKSANIGLSGGNLSAFATANLGGDQLVRATSFKTSGKWYFEITRNVNGSEDGTGLANSSESLSNYIGQTGNSCGIYSSGNFYISGGSPHVGPAMATKGHALGIAVDIPNALIWMRDQTAGGNWNGSTLANPATGVGGWSISALGANVTICGDCSSGPSGGGGTQDQVLNTGNTSFTGTLPTGFTAWDAGAPAFNPTRNMFLLAKG